ncbi:hypothetical protein H5399_05195 [Tessaracoccus sp. MC1627]|uniref:hypothetical protein n=1 Tax=Tessaracoccus sp. MC1627 TaxID=2760312 RepID=UPI001600A5D7|nr:hypothetical protein [Tessaracoccus sp. MC1627]MBB1512000.1 hypothetical protein [Tessaracoccus sp. MC1627]
MTDLTPERLTILRGMVATSGTYSTCIPGRDLRALLGAAEERDRLAAAVERVRALHVGGWGCGNPSHTNPKVGCPDCFMECDACAEMCPCATIRALDGTDADADRILRLRRLATQPIDTPDGDAILVADVLDILDDKGGPDELDRLRVTVQRVRQLAEQYEADAQSEGYGGESWATTRAAIRRALEAPHE